MEGQYTQPFLYYNLIFYSEIFPRINRIEFLVIDLTSCQKLLELTVKNPVPCKFEVSKTSYYFLNVNI